MQPASSYCQPRSGIAIDRSVFFFRYVFLLLILFLMPGIIMITAYGLTSLELYRGIKFEMANRKSNRGMAKYHRLTIILQMFS